MLVPETIAAIPVLVASFVGSAHCMGMCGGFVAVYSRSAGTAVIPHLLYNLGRLCTYLTLGALAASAGKSIDIASGTARVTSLVVAVWLIGVGTVSLFRRGQLVLGKLQKVFTKPIAAVAAPVLRGSGPLKPFLIGLVTTLLPCGWLYTFVALAAGAAAVVPALVIMTCFWLGSLPAMLGVGVASRFLTDAAGLRMPRVTALLVVMSGLLSLSLHVAHGSHSHSHHHSHQSAPDGVSVPSTSR